ncbi:16S rRNA (guanine(966)-N(2))-methyltransferase [hydrothermal vent metagenome]|uniref:16S rRNA (Guanine(966)-N(2))-methyltransferase n=1 Tax=hydrothermal vent metagenome TaxID=652676 RepID=A0A3B0WCU9_9ZZZZ
MNNGTCRIIGGKWRGRKVAFDDAEGLRPTTDRIRETVFNWLQPYLQQSHCLDAFAGSGVLGFEALSRGASEVVFIEKNIKTAKKIQENIDVLGFDDAHVFHQDVLHWLQSKKILSKSIVLGSNEQPAEKKFDLVFLDPPFYLDLLTKAGTLLIDSDCLAEKAIIYVEHNVDENIKTPENWFCLKEKKAGQVVYRLFENQVK